MPACLLSRNPPPSPDKIVRVGLDKIAIRSERLRALRPDRVAELAESIQVNGLLQPIVLRTGRGKSYWLVAGRHRFEAAKLLKWADIRACVFEDMSADAAELTEIDENLIHVDLTPAERALHVARRKELYERLHPKTRQGKAPGAGRGKRRSEESQIETFVSDAARRTGKSRATIARDAKRGKDIDADLLGDVVGTSLDKGDEMDALAKLDRQEQAGLVERARSGEKVSAKHRVKQVARAEREQELAKKITALPAVKAGVIVADPEWRFEPWSRQTGMDRAADNHYPTSLLEVIKSRPVADIAAADAALFLWATVPMLPHALEVMTSWGFEYVSHYVWIKNRLGTGYWNRNRHELLLIGTRGNIPAPAMGDQYPSAIEAPVGEHSAKPDVFLDLIDAYFPNVPKIELNRRGPARPGWSAWGNESINESAPTNPWADLGIPDDLRGQP